MLPLAQPIQTPRLTLRPFSPADFDDLYAYQSRPEVAEAAAAMLTLAFDRLGWHRVTGSCDARNHPSARLMERLGMRREAHFVQNMMVKGEWTDELGYAILDREWKAHGAAS